MRPRFRFTLDNNKSISEPIGWNQIEMNLERDLTYHSLIENVELPLEFYGSDAEHDGGYQYLKEARAYGIDTQIEFLAEISFDDAVSYETFFSGLLDLTTLIEIEHLKKFQCAIIRNNLWAKFINRKSIPVDIRSSVDLDGVAKTAMANQTLQLLSQEIRTQFSATEDADTTYLLTGATIYGQIDFGTVIIDEIKNRNILPKVINATRPLQMFEAFYAGDYQVAFTIFLTDATLNTQVTNIQIYVQINDNAVIASTITQLGINGVSGRTQFTYSATHSLNVGNYIRIYIQNTAGVPNTVILAGLSVQQGTISVIADTVYRSTQAEGFYIHDVAYGIMDRISEGVSFYSEYFGASFTYNVDYADDGCGADYQLFKGLHVRGYTLAQKPFSTSFDDWWEGVNNIFNLGLGYETLSYTVGGGGGGGTKEFIRVEEKEHFYDSSSNSVDLENVGGQEDGSGGGIEISFDADYLFTSIEIGYRKWEAETSSGIDDPQTVHTYASRFKTVGSAAQKDLSIISPFLAASLAIEQTRRETIEKGKDWKLDEDTMIIQTDQGASPEAVRLYNDDYLASIVITGLLNSETRYNVRLTPASNFARWKNYIANAFQNYTGDVFRFVKGEGNTDMTFSNPAATGCDAEAGTSADENANIVVGSDFLFLPVIYKFEHPLTWTEYKAIRTDRKKSIGISWYDNENALQTSKLFIKKLTFKVNESIGNFECWLKSNLSAEVYAALLNVATSLGYSLPSTDQQAKQISFISALMDAGIWDSLDVLYVFATDGDSDFATLNWKNPSTFKCTKVNSPTFTANEGFNGNGTTSYLDTEWDPATNGVNFTQNENGIFCHVNDSLSGFPYGNEGAGTTGQNLIAQVAGNLLYSNNSGGSGSVANTNDIALYHNRRVASNEAKVYKNGVLLGTAAVASNGFSSQDMFVCAFNDNGSILYSSSQISVFAIGTSLTGKELALYTAWNNYFNSL